MFRTTALIITAAALTACASTSSTDSKAAQKSAHATTVEIVAPEPVKAPVQAPDAMTDVTGKKLMTSDEGAKAEAVEEAAPEAAAEAPAAAKLENLYYVAQTKWEMIKFIEAVNAAELATALEADGAMTVFAPTTEAFDRAGDAAATADVLKGHIVSGKLTSKDLIARAAKGESTLATLAGTELTLYVSGETVKVADSSGRLYTVTQADADANNGVLHMINGVLSGK